MSDIKVTIGKAETAVCWRHLSLWSSPAMPAISDQYTSQVETHAYCTWLQVKHAPSLKAVN